MLLGTIGAEGNRLKKYPKTREQIANTVADQLNRQHISPLVKELQALEEKYQARFAVMLATAEPTYEESLFALQSLKALQERVQVLSMREEK